MARGYINYVMARTHSKRPTLQHIVTNKGDEYTLCGHDLTRWNRYWMDRKISVLLCRRCARIAGITL